MGYLSNEKGTELTPQEQAIISELANLGNPGDVPTVDPTGTSLEYKPAVSSDEKVKLSASDPTAGYLDAKLQEGVTAIKAASSAGFSIKGSGGTTAVLFGAGGGNNTTFYDGVKLDSQTADRILGLDSSKNITALDTATYPSLTELSYVKGVTSAIQTQLDAKANLNSTNQPFTYLGLNSLSTSQRILFRDGGGVGLPSFDWQNGTWFGDDGASAVMQIDYGTNTVAFPQLNTNGFLKTINGDGTLAVDTNTYLTDAPSDGTPYGRKDGAWSAVVEGSGANTRVAYFNGTNGITSNVGFTYDAATGYLSVASVAGTQVGNLQIGRGHTNTNPLNYGVNVGNSNTVSRGTITIGSNNTNTNGSYPTFTDGGVVIGYNNTCLGGRSFVAGVSCSTTLGAPAVAVGYGAIVNSNAVAAAFGINVTNSRTSTVMIGTESARALYVDSATSNTLRVQALANAASSSSYFDADGVVNSGFRFYRSSTQTWTLTNDSSDNLTLTRQVGGAVNYFKFDRTSLSGAVGYNSSYGSASRAFAVGYTASVGATDQFAAGALVSVPSTASAFSINVGATNATNNNSGVLIYGGGNNNSASTNGLVSWTYGSSFYSSSNTVANGNGLRVASSQNLLFGNSIYSPFANLGAFGNGSTGSIKGLTVDVNLGRGGVNVRNPQATFDAGGDILASGSTLGSELVVNGGFATDTDWTKGTGWAISGGVATHTGGTSGALSPSVALTPTVGKIYEISFDVITGSNSGSTLTVTFGGVTTPVFSNGGNNQMVTTGYKLRVVATTTGNLSIAATNTIIIDNVSIKEVTGGGTIRANGVITTRGYTVATLPTGTIGDRAYVTDALAPTFLTAVVGGGAVVCPVFYDGTNWVAN